MTLTPKTTTTHSSCHLIKLPAKIILSGEHAVTLGCPAIACSIEQYFNLQSYLQTDKPSSLSINNPYFSNHYHFELAQIKKRGSELKQRYSLYLQKQLSINQVLPQETDLILFCTALFIEQTDLDWPGQITLNYKSEVASGCGLGSSALTIVATLKTLAHQFNSPLAPAVLHQLGLQAENMQHGQSSGLDIHMAIEPGLTYYRQGHFKKITGTLPPFYTINTGQPQATTGQSVACSQKILNAQPSLLQRFQDNTELTVSAFKKNNPEKWYQGIIDNQQLLNHIGVVPQRIQSFCQDLQNIHCASKICGAGSSIEGAAGIVLALAKDHVAEKKLVSLCRQQGYPLARHHLNT